MCDGEGKSGTPEKGTFYVYCNNVRVSDLVRLTFSNNVVQIGAINFIKVRKFSPVRETQIQQFLKKIAGQA